MKTGLLQLNCLSPLAEYAAEYISQKRALGLKCRGEVQILNMFDSFCVEHDLSEPAIPQPLFDIWCLKRPHENGTTHNMRIGHIRRFAKFLTNNGVDAPTVFLPLPKPDKKFLPHIFTHDEIRRLLAQADKTKACRHYDRQSLAHLIMPLLFRMLYCCGLRINEALKLKTSMADLRGGILKLSETKNYNERLVPMSSSLTQLCAEYRANPLVKNYGGEYFFPASDGTHYSVCTIYERFREYLWSAGIGHGGRGKGPRLHDIRHTFAVHTLNKWASEGKDIYVTLPSLMRYLGHKSIKSTEKYVRLVPEAYAQVTIPFEEHFGDVFPEVRYEN